MTTATITISKVQKNLQSRIDSVDMPTINWKAFCCIGFIITLPLLVFYVWQVNDLTRGSYVINTYNKQLSQLTEQNKNLQVSFAENSFLGQAIVKIEALNFQKSASVKYVQIPEDSLSLAKK